MGFFKSKTNLEKFETKQKKLNEKISKENSKAQDILTVAGVQIDGIVIALIAQPSSLSSPTKNVWVITEEGISKVSGIPPAHPREYFSFSDVESVSVSTEIFPTVALRVKGRYVTFKADALMAQYFAGIVSEKIKQG